MELLGTRVVFWDACFFNSTVKEYSVHFSLSVFGMSTFFLQISIQKAKEKNIHIFVFLCWDVTTIRYFLQAAFSKGMCRVLLPSVESQHGDRFFNEANFRV